MRIRSWFFFTRSPSLTGSSTISPVTSGVMATMRTGLMMPVADTSWVMSRRAAFSVCTMMPGSFFPQTIILSMINKSTLPTMIQMIFLRDFTFFPLAMCLFSFSCNVSVSCSSRRVGRKISLRAVFHALFLYTKRACHLFQKNRASPSATLRFRFPRLPAIESPSRIC